MKRLIENGDVILDGTKTRAEKEKEAFEQLEMMYKFVEIIKEKNVFVWGFIHRQEETKDFEWTYDYYKTHYGYFHSGYKFELLTKEEHNLLKEVLLDEIH